MQLILNSQLYQDYKMRKTILSILLLPLISSASTNMEQRIQYLENELKSLKEEVTLNSNDIEDSLPILDSVEKKTILDQINFSPELTLRFDKMDYTTAQIEGEDTKIYTHHDPALDGLQRRDEYSKDFDIASSIRFRLNMNAQITDNVNFHGRLVYMNSTQSHQRLCILSRDIKSSESLSAFDVDLAYINFTPNKASDYAFTFTFGLLPTAGGTPMQFAQNKKRNSMFPALVFDMNTYGIIGTQKIAKDTFLRAVVAKAYTMRPTFYPYQCNRENIDNANIFGLYGDTKFNFLGDSLLSFGLNMLHDLKAHPYLGPDVGSEDSHILGNIITFGAGLDIQKFADTDTTIFIHSALSNPHGNGEVDDYQIVDYVDGIGVTESGKVGFSEADYAKGTMLSSDGYSIYLGAKYDMSTTINIGAEFNYGSKYWYSATQGAQDMYNKLAIRGHVTELYGIWKFHKNLYTKLGLMTMHEEYTGSGWHFGEPAKKDATQEVAYLSIEAKF
jgi:hypothetical protein